MFSIVCKCGTNVLFPEFETDTEVRCYHCGDLVGQFRIVVDGEIVRKDLVTQEGVCHIRPKA